MHIDDELPGPWPNSPCDAHQLRARHWNPPGVGSARPCPNALGSPCHESPGETMDRGNFGWASKGFKGLQRDSKGFKGLQRASSANFCWEVVCERWLVEIPVEMSQMSSKKCLLWFCGLVEGCSIPMIGSYHLETFGNHFETELWLALDSIMAIYWLQLSIAQLQGVHHCRSPIGIIDINLKISQEPRFKEFSQLQRGKVPEGLPGTVTSSWQEYTGFGGEIPWFWTVVSYSTSYFVTSKSKLHLYLSIYIFIFI